MRTLLLTALLALSACGTSGSSSKAKTGDDTGADAAQDTTADTALDTDATDINADTAQDTTADTDAADTSADTMADTADDTTADADATDTTADTMTDTADDTTADTDATDATADTAPIPPDWIPSRCSPIEAELAAALDEAAMCDRSSQCATELNPICPYAGGCYQLYRLGKDRTAVAEVVNRFMAENCGDFVCRCAAPTPSGCYDGRCQTCPEVCPTACPADCICATDGCGCPVPTCAGSLTDCGGLVDAMRVAITDMQPCNLDSDCTSELAPACSELGCFYARNTASNPAHLGALADSWNGLGCASLSTTACRCGTPPAPVCRDNRCVIE